MQIGNLDVEVTRGPRPQLVVTGRTYGLETDVTAEGLVRLAQYLTVQAATLRNETTGNH